MENELKKALEVLCSGGVIIYPTDTIWGIGCDATVEESVKKIYKIKQREESKSLIILVNDWEMLTKYIEKIPSKVSCILEGTSKPTSVIYQNPKGLAQNVVAKDNSVAIRIVKDEFCQRLISEFGKPIVSTSANNSGKPAPRSFSDIDKSLLEKADYVVNLQREKKSSVASQIVKVHENGKIDFLRK